MSTTVTYKGSTLTTVNNSTRTLKTAGKYMEGDVVITDVKTYTATLISSGSSACYVQYPSSGTKYYTKGGVFEFVAGAILHIAVNNRDKGSSIYIDEELVQSGDYGISYDYILPSSNISIDLLFSGSSYAKITTGSSGGGATINNQDKSVTPSESQQTVTADSGYTGLGTVTVGAISSTYVGTGITRRSATDMSGAYDKEVGSYQVSAPAGYYSSESWFTVPNGTIETPTATKGTVSNHSVSITPSVFHRPGYIHGGIEEGTAVTVSASELVSGTYTVNSSGTKDITNYESISVASGSATAPSTISGTAASVSTGTNTLTLTKTISVTPTVSAGYVSSGTAGNSSVSLTASVTTKAAATITPTTTNQTIAAGTYLTGAQTIAGDADLVGSNILSTANIFGVQGTVDFIDVYIRSAAPTSSVGNDGDIYIQS